MYNSEEDNRFKTISEFKECVIRGGEPVFLWNGDVYGVCFVDSGIVLRESTEHMREYAVLLTRFLNIRFTVTD